MRASTPPAPFSSCYHLLHRGPSRKAVLQPPGCTAAHLPPPTRRRRPPAAAAHPPLPNASTKTQVVTYKWLARHFSVPFDTSKRILFEFLTRNSQVRPPL